MKHELKILPDYFMPVVIGEKTFEVRKNDRDFKVGDILLLREWTGTEYTGKALEVKVNYILDDESGFVLDGYVVMSIS